MRSSHPRHRRTKRTVKLGAAVVVPLLIAGGVYAMADQSSTSRGGEGTLLSDSELRGRDVSPPVTGGSDEPTSDGAGGEPTPTPSADDPAGNDRRDDPGNDGRGDQGNDGDGRGEHDGPGTDDPPNPTSSPTTHRPPTATPTPTPTHTPPSPSPTPSSTPTVPDEPPGPPAPGDLDLEVDLLNAANGLRGLGCPDLRLDSRLTEAAREHSADMRRRDFFGHDNPDGETPQDRARSAGYTAPGGENLARDIPGAEAVVIAWLLQSEQRSNLLDCDYVSVGIGVNDGSSGTWWTMMFGYE